MDQLEHLAKNLENEELQRIWQSTQCYSNMGTTVLHLAVLRNKLPLVKYLAETGCDVDLLNSSSDTALLIALKLSNFEAAKILLDADADVRAIDAVTGKTALGLMMSKGGLRYVLEVTNGIVSRLIDNLKRSNLDVEALVDLLVASGCPLKFVWLLNDAQVSRTFLENNPSGNYQSEMNLAMARRDHDNVEVILRYGNASGRLTFYQNLLRLILDDRPVDPWRICMEGLLDWYDIGEQTLGIIDLMFKMANADNLKVLLDCKIEARVREKFGIDLRASIFANYKVDATKLLRKQNFNLNSSGMKGRTALHFATKTELVTNLWYLLGSGVDVNVKDNEGRTALFDCVDSQRSMAGRVLLENGADVQAADNDGLTAFEFAQSKNSPLLEFFIAQLAIVHVQGKPIDRVIRNQIDSDENLRKIYDECCQQLQNLKTHEIGRSTSLFHVFTRKIETLCQLMYNYYERDTDIVDVVEQYNNEHKLHSHYYASLKFKLAKVSDLYYFKCDMAKIISERTRQIIDLDHLVLSKICEYLTPKDTDDFIESKIQTYTDNSD